MKNYLGFKYNEDHELKEAYAYDVTPEQEDKITDILYYYKRFDVYDMVEKHPGFVAQDLQTLLDMLEEILEV